MAGCPLRNFARCPQHNKKGGCEWWMAYTSSSGVTAEGRMEGCAVVLQPMLLLEQANAMGKLEGRVNQVSAEISAGRVEHVKEGDALRRQLVSLATGQRTLVQPAHGTAIEPAKQPGLEGGQA